MWVKEKMKLGTVFLEVGEILLSDPDNVVLVGKDTAAVLVM